MNFSFDIKVKGFEALFKDKLSKLELNDLKLNCKVIDGNAQLYFGKDIDAKVKTILKEALEKKVLVFLNHNFLKWVENYTALPSLKNSKWQHYENSFNTEQGSTMKFKWENKELTVVEQFPMGRHQTSYEYSQPKWAKSKLVLKVVLREILEGDQAVRTKTEIFYQFVDQLGHLPTMLEIIAEQKIQSQQGRIIMRKLPESYVFSNFKIIQN